MNRTTGLFLLLPIFLLLESSCSSPSERKPLEHTWKDGPQPICIAPPADVMARGVNANADFAAAKIGDPCENVDIAARQVLVDAGYGPGYKLPGCPHRTGHGIGMDGHEWGNMVLGNKLLLQPGMCFSVEPNISIYGEFGVRLEDCVYMTEAGPKWFSQPSTSIDQPFTDPIA